MRRLLTFENNKRTAPTSPYGFARAASNHVSYYLDEESEEAGAWNFSPNSDEFSLFCNSGSCLASRVNLTAYDISSFLLLPISASSPFAIAGGFVFWICSLSLLISYNLFVTGCERITSYNVSIFTSSFHKVCDLTALTQKCPHMAARTSILLMSAARQSKRPCFRPEALAPLPFGKIAFFFLYRYLLRIL